MTAPDTAPTDRAALLLAEIDAALADQPLAPPVAEAGARLDVSDHHREMLAELGPARALRSAKDFGLALIRGAGDAGDDPYLLARTRGVCAALAEIEAS